MAAASGLSDVTSALLSRDSVDPNVQTVSKRDTALHLAIAGRHLEVIAAILKRFRETEGYNRPDLDLKNSSDQSPLSLALSRGLLEIGTDLLKGET